MGRCSHLHIAAVAPLASMAVGPRASVVAESGRVAAAINLSVSRSGFAAGDDASVSALADHTTVTDVCAVGSDVQLDVVCDAEWSAAGSDRIGDSDTVRTSSDGETVAKVDAVLRAAFGCGVFEQSVSCRSGTDDASADVDPMTRLAEPMRCWRKSPKRRQKGEQQSGQCS